MTIKTFIEKAIEGGWEKPSFGWETEDESEQAVMFLDPLAWQAVGIVVGWDDYGSRVQMHNMIDALTEGKSLKEFIETL